MKKVFFAVIFFGLSSTFAFSQKANNNEIKSKVEHVKSLINLTDDQAKKLVQIEADFQNRSNKFSQNTNKEALAKLREKG
ncbi:MAG: hypothetical protein IPH58_13205 [Sphingobacteriales bacterium]|nr:hypothetical protein [Sphingobacteriales bacterium]